MSTEVTTSTVNNVAVAAQIPAAAASRTRPEGTPGPARETSPDPARRHPRPGAETGPDPARRHLRPGAETGAGAGGDGRGPPALAHPGRRRAGPADGGARRHDRDIALPSAQQALHFTNVDRQWIVTAYALAFGSLLLLGGRVSTLLGRRRRSSAA